MNIEIDIDPAAMKPDDSGVSMIGVWAGTVRYPHAEGYPKREGWLVIAKLAVPATAPFDIIDLARTLPSFPNNPTADQLYTDQKFEAYRALGHHLGAEAVVAGTAIRELRQQGRSVGDAVAQVNKALCARGLAAIKPECEPPKDAEEK
jgi:hypothetical protein